ncbi:spindle pole body interacting protein [Atractiella rhizophila]|nr:spindle pole body interacting protein [Atractiella rhizophila]
MSSSSPQHGTQHATFVLLAEFDVDRGTTLEHQFPCPTGVNEQTLAELMLPEGAQNRSEDWTVFYLNSVTQLRASDPSRLDESPNSLKEEWERDPRLMYCLSLMRNKPDQNIKRGANYKAMAVCSYYPYIHIWKPILLLALESYFSNPSISVLSSLYNAINGMDVSALPQLSRDEKIVLKFSERRDLFEEKFSAQEEGPYGPAVGLGLVYRGNGNGADVGSSMHRSESSTSLTASLKSTSSRPPFKHRPSDASFTEDLVSSSTVQHINRHHSRPSVGTLSDLSHHSSESDEQEVLRAVTGNSKAGHVNGRPITILQSRVNATSGTQKKPKDTHVFESKLKFGGIELPVRIPLATFDEEVGDYFLIKLIQTFANSPPPAAPMLHPHLHSSGRDTHPIVLLFNAIITEKRVIFLGHQTSSGQVANMVHAACALGSGCGTVLKGVTGRSFPYANLESLSYLKNVPGFIAGVVNPIFEYNTSEWDLLFNIDTGKVLISKDITLPTGTSTTNDGSSTDGDIGRNPLPSATGNLAGKDSYDAAFMDEITTAISAHFGEQVIAARFTEYLQRIIRLASKYEEEKNGNTTIGYTSRGVMGQNTLGSGLLTADGSTANAWSREVEANAGRIEGWRATKSYRIWREDFAKYLENKSIQGFDVWYQLTRIRLGRKLPPSETLYISRALAQNTRTDDQITELLSMTPSHQGGLLPLAFGLFHNAEDVRNNFVELFDNINSSPTGRKFIQSMNTFHRMAYQRLSQEREAALKGIAIEYNPVPISVPLSTPTLKVSTVSTLPNGGGTYMLASPATEYPPPLPTTTAMQFGTP